MEKVVIIGSGCAGWTAALYTARAQLAPLVLTGIQPGGLLTTTSIVENFPGFPEGVDGYELMTRMQKQAERFGARVSFGTVEKVDFSQKPFSLTVDGELVQSETVILATGASHKHLEVPGEELLETKGVTYCATCDGALPIFRQKPLVVVGGGDSACEEALYLTRFGSIVYLVHRRESLRASKIMAERVLAHKSIKPIWDSAVTEILEVKQDKVTGVKLKHLKTGEESLSSFRLQKGSQILRRSEALDESPPNLILAFLPMGQEEQEQAQDAQDNGYCPGYVNVEHLTTSNPTTLRARPELTEDRKGPRVIVCIRIRTE